jgi:DNA modification methylase
MESNIGSALDNASCPIHNWYKFTAGFSYKFIDKIVDDLDEKPHRIYDPFAGCGTTLVAAQEKQIPSVGNESQQFMCDIINAKLNWNIKRQVCDEYIKGMLDTISKNQDRDIDKEYHPLLVSLYDPQTLKNLYLLRDYIKNIEINEYKLFFELALSQTLHKSALHPIAVPYIVRSKNLSHSGDAIGKFTTIVYKMLNDLETVKGIKRTALVYHDDSRYKNAKIKDGSCDMCITSPPYLNNLDYGEVSKVHTHFFGYTNNWHDITEKVRKHLVTGSTTHYVDSEFKMDEFLQTEFASKNEELIKDLLPKYEILCAEAKKRKGKKSFNILMMEYFRDMYNVLKEMRRVLKTQSPAYLILGDSAPYGVFIPTTKYLGEVAESAGFEDYNIIKIRSRGHKWKNLSHRHNVELSENILILH